MLGVLTLGKMFFAFAVLAGTSFASPLTDGCTEALKPLSPSGRLTEEVAVIWYPKAGYAVISHAELEVSGDVWGGLVLYHKNTTSEAIEKTARKGNKGFFRFRVAVTPEELENLKTFLTEHDGKFTYNMCIGGVCRALRSSTGLYIPPLIRHIPTLSAIYLAGVRVVRPSRVPAIEYVGKNGPVRNLITLEVPYELFISYQIGTAVYGALNSLIKVGLAVANPDDDEKKKRDQEEKADAEAKSLKTAEK